jgi:hypothetical protein
MATTFLAMFVCDVGLGGGTVDDELDDGVDHEQSHGASHVTLFFNTCSKQKQILRHLPRSVRPHHRPCGSSEMKHVPAPLGPERTLSDKIDKRLIVNHGGHGLYS